MIYTIEEIQNIIIPIVKEYGVAKISLFGSYTKGLATEDSDIDFIMDKSDLKGLQYFSLLRKLEDTFNCNIDLITTDFSNKALLTRIHDEEVLLYER